MKHFNLSIIDAIRVQYYFERSLAHKVDKIMRRYDNGLFTMIELPKHIREEFLTNVKKIKEMISYM